MNRASLLFVGKQKRKPRTLWHPTPWDGQTGFWAAWNRFFYQFEGPARVGRAADEPERPQRAEPRCPMCQQLMVGHEIIRTPGKSTRVVCPVPSSAAVSDKR